MKITFIFFLLAVLTGHIHAQTNHGYAEKEIIYGRKDGLALTMVENRPPGASNGRGIIWVVSGSWFSSYTQRPGKDRLKAFLDRGYTVFEVIHGSQPKYNIEEALADLQQAVRFIRYHAEEYGIDPNRLGISGSSAGGHLSLLLGLMDGKGNPAATNPVNRVSSKLQAVAVFFPPTDFTNWGGFKDMILQKQLLQASNVHGAFNFKKYDSSSRSFVSITDSATLRQKARDFSPASHVSPDDPPVFIYHGDKDKVVPIQQSQVLVKMLVGATVPVSFKVKPGADHGWKDQWDELGFFADWFDQHLK